MQDQQVLKIYCRAQFLLLLLLLLVLLLLLLSHFSRVQYKFFLIFLRDLWTWGFCPLDSALTPRVPEFSSSSTGSSLKNQLRNVPGRSISNSSKILSWVIVQHFPSLLTHLWASIVPCAICSVNPNPEHEDTDILGLLDILRLSLGRGHFLPLTCSVCASDIKPHPPSLLECSWVPGQAWTFACKMPNVIIYFNISSQIWIQALHLLYPISPRIMLTFRLNNVSIISPSTNAIHPELLNSCLSKLCSLLLPCPCPCCTLSTCCVLSRLPLPFYLTNFS